MDTLETLKAAAFVDSDVVTYTPRDNWCHHGIAIIHIDGGKTWATDTYWGSSPTDLSYVNMFQLDTANIIGNQHTFDKVPYPHEYSDFADADKYYIPLGGGAAYKRVRTGAVPVPALVRVRLAEAVESAEYELASASRKLQRTKDELNKFDKG